MRKLLIALLLILLFATPVNPATMVSGRPCPGGAGVAPSCTTPTGDELTESFGDSSSLCWTDGSSVCNNTWTIKIGTPAIAAVPAGSPANTSCTNGFYFDASSAAVNIYTDLGDGKIPNNVETVINATVYIDSSSIAQYSSITILALNATTSSIAETTNRYVTLAIRKATTGTGVFSEFYINGVSCTAINDAEDTWFNLTITLDAAGEANGSTLSDGTNSCNFTRGTVASRYLWTGANATNVIGYIGNVRVSTP